MTKNKLFLCAAVLGLCSATVALAQTAKLAYFETQPHSYLDKATGKPAGAAVAFAEAVFKKAGMAVEWVGPLPFARVVANLESGEVDGTFLLGMNDDRKKFLLYAEKPHNVTYSVLVVKAAHPLKEIKTIDDVKGFKIGYVTDGRIGAFLKDAGDKVSFDLIGSDNWQELNFRKVQGGRIDASYSPVGSSTQYELARLKMDKDFRLLKLPEDPQTGYFAFSRKSPKAALLKDAYDKAVASGSLAYEDFLAAEFKKAGR